VFYRLSFPLLCPILGKVKESNLCVINVVARVKDRGLTMDKSNITVGTEVKRELLRAVGAKTEGIISHLSRGKWHMSKVALTYVGESCIHVDILHKDKPLPLNINLEQPIGLTFKLDYSKYVCESTVVGFEPSINSSCGGKLVLDMPMKLEKMQKRSFYRVQVPDDMSVKATLWHRGFADELVAVPNGECCEGRLLDLSAGGLQIGVSKSKKPNYKLGQLIGMQFTALSGRKPMVLEGQIRHVAKTADGNNVCLGVQIVGLEASHEGREKLRQIVEIVDEYQKINKASGISLEKVLH